MASLLSSLIELILRMLHCVEDMQTLSFKKILVLKMEKAHWVVNL